jgi:hypothetical protein
VGSAITGKFTEGKGERVLGSKSAKWLEFSGPANPATAALLNKVSLENQTPGPHSLKTEVRAAASLQTRTTSFKLSNSDDL